MGRVIVLDSEHKPNFEYDGPVFDGVDITFYDDVELNESTGFWVSAGQYRSVGRIFTGAVRGTIRVTEAQLREFSRKVEAGEPFHMVGAARMFNALAVRCNRQTHEKGFWDEDHGHHTTGTKLNLIHAEVSEATEAGRKVETPFDLGSTVTNSHPSEHIPEFTGTEEELADSVIRILDLAVERKCRLFEAIIAKLDFNATREYMHGKKT